MYLHSYYPLCWPFWADRVGLSTYANNGLTKRLPHFHMLMFDMNVLDCNFFTLVN